MGRGSGRVTILQKEAHRVVALEADGATVRKTFVGTDGEPLMALAAREHDRLDRFSKALAAVDGATCPEPVELRDGSRPLVRMTRAAGSPLSDALRHRMDPDERAWLVRVVTDALTVYVTTFSEPYYDFHFRNMLYDAAGRQVTFLDFGVPDHLLPVRPALDQLSPVDSSLGNLYGSTLFEAVRPRNLHRVAQNRRLVSLATSVVEALLVAIPPHAPELAPSGPGMRKATETVFSQSVSWGPRSHRLWYRLFPRHLVRGEQRLDRVFAAAPVGRTAPASHQVVQ